MAQVASSQVGRQVGCGPWPRWSGRAAFSAGSAAAAGLWGGAGDAVQGTRGFRASGAGSRGQASIPDTGVRLGTATPGRVGLGTPFAGRKDWPPATAIGSSFPFWNHPVLRIGRGPSRGRQRHPTGGCSPTDLASPPPPCQVVALSQVLRLCCTCPPLGPQGMSEAGAGAAPLQASSRLLRECLRRRRGQREPRLAGSPKSVPCAPGSSSPGLGTIRTYGVGAQPSGTTGLVGGQSTLARNSGVLATVPQLLMRLQFCAGEWDGQSRVWDQGRDRLILNFTLLPQGSERSEGCREFSLKRVLHFPFSLWKDPDMEFAEGQEGDLEALALPPGPQATSEWQYL